MAGCKDINDYVNEHEHLPLPSPWEQKSDESDTWYENPKTKESIWERPDNNVVQAVVSRIKDRTRNEILDTLLTKPAKVLIDLLGTPAIQLCFGKDKESKIKELEDAAEKEINDKKEAAAKILREGAGAKFASSANKTKISPKSITEIYGILDKLYNEKKNLSVVWERHIDKDEIWYVSPSGESVWELPGGNTAVNAAPTEANKEAAVKKIQAKYRNYQTRKTKAKENAKAAANAQAAAKAEAEAKAKLKNLAIIRLKREKLEKEAKAAQNVSNRLQAQKTIKKIEEELTKKDKDGKTMLMTYINSAGITPGDEYKKKAIELINNTEMLGKSEIEIKTVLNIVDNTNETALMLAAKYGFLDITSLLLTKGADIDKKNKDGNTALMLASQEGYIEIVNLLIKKGADINIKNNDGNTGFMLACLKKHMDVANVFIKKGVDLSEVNKKGETAFILALKHRYEDSDVNVNIFWADKSKKDVIDTWINISTTDSETASSIAIKNHNKYIKWILFNASKTRIDTKYINVSLLYIAAGFNNLNALELLITLYESNPNEYNKDFDFWYTPLMKAAVNGNKEIVEALLKNGANPMCKVLNKKEEPLEGIVALVQNAKKSYIDNQTKQNNEWKKAWTDIEDTSYTDTDNYTKEHIKEDTKIKQMNATNNAKKDYMARWLHTKTEEFNNKKKTAKKMYDIAMSKNPEEEASDRYDEIISILEQSIKDASRRTLPDCVMPPAKGGGRHYRTTNKSTRRLRSIKNKTRRLR